MTRTRLATLTLGIWTVLFVLSFVLLFSLEPTGDGFVRGLNRIMAFLTWQGIAFVAAIVALLAGRGIDNETPGTRWLSRIPVIIQSLMLLAVVGLILATRFTKPVTEPGVPQGSATAPAPALAAPLEPPADIQEFNGIFRAGFESSHFYTMDGRGPWWLEAIGDELAYLGIDGYRLHVVSIEGMRTLSEQEYEMVLEGVVGR
jgi:hypothetical protein